MPLPAILAGIGRVGLAAGRTISTAAGRGVAMAKSAATKIKTMNDARKAANAAKTAESSGMSTGAKVATAAGAGLMGGALIEKMKGAGNTAVEGAKHFGTHYLVVLLIYHFIKTWWYADRSLPLYFLIISVLMVLWVVNAEGYSGKNALPLIIILLALEYFGIANILEMFGIGSQGWATAIYWPWLFYFVIINKIIKKDFGVADGVVIMITILFIAQVTGLAERYDLFATQGSDEKKAAEEKAAELEEGKTEFTRWDKIGFWWDCVMDGKLSSKARNDCIDKKINPPKEEQKISSLVEEGLEPMRLEIVEDKLIISLSAQEFNGLLTFISPRGDKDVDLECSLYDIRARSGIEVEGDKKTFEDESLIFAEKFHCEPKTSLAQGSYIYQIIANVKDIETTVELDSFFVGKKELDSLEKEYMSELFKQGLDTTTILAQVEKKRKDWYDNLETLLKNAYGGDKVASKSSPDLSELALSIGPSTLNGIEEGDELTLTIAMQNTVRDSKIRDVKELSIKLPKGATVKDECNGKFSSKILEDETVQLDATESFLDTFNFGSITYTSVGAKPLASCKIIISNLAEFLPDVDHVEHKIFEGVIKYDQAVRKNFSKRITSSEAPADATSVDVQVASERNSALAEKIRSHAKNHGVPENIALAVATKESGIKHYDSSGGVITNGADWGVMQVNQKAHESAGCFSASAAKSGVCNVNSCSGTSVLLSEDCNIEAGFMILKNCYNQGTSNYPDGREYKCNGKTYKGWDYALRCYNGWGESSTVCSFARNYVEDVNALA